MTPSDLFIDSRILINATLEFSMSYVQWEGDFQMHFSRNVFTLYLKPSVERIPRQGAVAKQSM